MLIIAIKQLVFIVISLPYKYYYILIGRLASSVWK
ncbi:hypothetical protein MBOVPG45_0437 [Mycoplasmopsis bovis PG45]|uniref:Uncharacterized protein n=1 Tax=Mycoplasmopsis bovis (strain ATCC 25523 / DSM 22781 / NCTC 10131 / PG45) TaxID=289397 RepID=A0A454AQR8_MYCBG|nr:hypothetical protein MBOVPG45_0437 [Mycoplasmopsis bovis PG45]